MEITEDYRKGFEDARRGALKCCQAFRYFSDARGSKDMQGAMELIDRMTPELHREYVEKNGAL